MNEFDIKCNKYKSLIEETLRCIIRNGEPGGLYNPIKYVIDGGGKRIRPVLVMLSSEALGGDPIKALPAATALEILHNFTLVHDDIMDNADTRRGRETIHRKWDYDTALLAGDGLIGIAYRTLFETDSDNLTRIAKIFTEGIIEICEGQSYDKEYETKRNVTIEEYIMMITKKTSVLLETCAMTGGLIANGSEDEIEILRQFGLNLGLAFQIQDDLLDIIADEKIFGKKTGGDLVEGKKTFLLLKALEIADKEEDRKILEQIISDKGIKENHEIKINEIKSVYKKYDIIETAKREIERYTCASENTIEKIKSAKGRELLHCFSRMLLSRTY